MIAVKVDNKVACLIEGHLLYKLSWLISRLKSGIHGYSLAISYAALIGIESSCDLLDVHLSTLAISFEEGAACCLVLAYFVPLTFVSLVGEGRCGCWAGTFLGNNEKDEAGYDEDFHEQNYYSHRNIAHNT